MSKTAIEMAREAGLGFFTTRESDNTSVDALERLINIVREDEREKAAKLVGYYAQNQATSKQIEIAIRNLK